MSAQLNAEKELIKKGFKSTRVLSNGTILMEKKFKKTNGHLFADVEEDGTVNGKTLQDFLKSIEGE
jgi:hypothetical protein